MPCAPVQPRPDTTRATSVGFEPFAFSAADGMTAGLQQFALMWSVPFRAFMVVMSEATNPRRY